MTEITTPLVHKWTTQVVPPSQRLDYWIGAICEGFLEMTATSPAAAQFAGSLESAKLGAIGVNRVCASAQDVYRTKSAIARSEENFFYLLCKPDATWTASQDGRGARLLPNDLLLVDSRRCYEFHFPVSADVISLELPTCWVESWLVDARVHVARRIDSQAGWGRTLSSFVQQLTPERMPHLPLPAELLGDQLGALLALATDGDEAARQPAAPETRLAPLHKRIINAIHERHAEPGLTANRVAQGLQTSERTLHRCLAAGGITFGQTLIDYRLKVAQRMLSEPRFDRITVGEIGRRVGLCDASHFVRLCRRHLGATPGTLRSARC